MDNNEIIKAQEMSDYLEAGVRGKLGVYPSWVYECQAALRHANEHPPVWLPDLLDALGWQSGTLHDALNAVRRLVAAEKERERNRTIRR